MYLQDLENTNVLKPTDYAYDRLFDLGCILSLKGTIQILVTPRLAKRWLKLNTVNRPLNKRTVLEYARRMKDGEWMLNGESIIFTTNGLGNGQHRLSAVCEYNSPVWFDVRFGVNPNAFSTIDNGRSRRAGDILAIKGIPNYQTVAGAAQKIFNLQKGLAGTSGINIDRRLSNKQVLEFVEENPNIVTLSSRVERLYKAGGRSLLTKSHILTYYYIFNEIDEVDAEVFMEGLCLGVGLNGDNPILLLRNKLTMENMDKNRSMTSSYKNKLVIKTWNLFRRGLSRKVLSIKSSSKIQMPI
jgi:hypothetical protein